MNAPALCPTCKASVQHALAEQVPATFCYSCICLSMGFGMALAEKAGVDLNEVRVQPSSPALHIVSSEE